MSLTILYWVLIAVMVVGVIGAVVPGVPGVGLILGSILVWAIATNFASVGVSLVAVFIILILSAAVDFLAAYWGTKKVGASKWSQIGAIVGLILGFLGLLPAFLVAGPLLGIFIGPILGAFLGEFLYRSDLAIKPRTILSAKASLAVVVSSLIGNIIQGLLAIVAVIIFIYSTWPPAAVEVGTFWLSN